MNFIQKLGDWLNKQGNPVRFERLAKKLIPGLAMLSLILGGIGLYLSFFIAPEDYQQGNTVKIMFIHVPSAWLAMFCYFIMAVTAVGTLVWKHPMADIAARAAAPLGAAFTFLALVTGALWGKPMWGAWWVWDARLTSVLILFLLYLGLIAIWQVMERSQSTSKVSAIVILVGFINIPIIKFSVDWWNTLHQPASVFRAEGSSIHPSMLWPLLIMAVACTTLFFTLHLMRMINELRSKQVLRLQTQLALKHRQLEG